MYSISKTFWNLCPSFGFKSANTRPKSRSKSRSRTVSASGPIIQYLGPWEANMITLQSILIWEKPGKSALAVISINLIYWYIALNGIQLFYCVSVLGLISFLRHQWVYSIWPEISIKPQTDQEDWTPVHPSVLSAPEVSRYLERLCNFVKEQQQRLLHLRKKQPGIFCFGMSTLFSLLWFLGRCVSGGKLLYAFIMGIMCGPAIFIHVIPKPVYSCLQNILTNLFDRRKMGDSCTSIESEIAEFLPEETAEARTALGIPFNTTGCTLDDEEEEELSNKSSARSRSKVKSMRGKSKGRLRNSSGASFSTGLNEEDFPSIEDSLNTLEENDLALPEFLLENSAEESNKEGITFVPTHFGDSSDDEDFTAGLSFKTSGTQISQHQQHEQSTTLPDVVDNLVKNVAAEHASSILSALGQQLASAMGAEAKDVKSQHSPISTSGSSSIDDEFELISDDDLQ